MGKIMVLGTKDGKFHPMKIIAALGDTLGDYEFEYTSDIDRILELDKHPIFICFLDLWQMEMSEKYSDALKKYMEDGGNILSIHSGICIANFTGSEGLHGAKFTGHPDICEISIKLIPGHPITDGLQDFCVNDEPYHFDVFGQITVLANYEYEGNTMPAAWEHKYGKGTLVYLMPGHDEAVFQNESYKKLIESSINYLNKCRS